MSNAWKISDPILLPGPDGSFDHVAVKDPSIVFFADQWHLFYTARSEAEYTAGYVSAKELQGLQQAPRHELERIRGKSRYGCAPQVFYFQPQGKWYLIYQTRDANYQPAFSTTATIARPETWTGPQPLIGKDARIKWIDFWVICDQERAYLFYTQAHQEVIVRSTALADFPRGWGEAEQAYTGVHEAVHVYKVIDQDEFHMIYELNEGDVRSFGLARSTHPAGPWEKVTDRYATGDQLRYTGKAWTDMVSHGEVLRSGYDQRMEYEPCGCRWIVQGILSKDVAGPYPSLRWKLGVMTRIEPASDGFG
jgi:arabinoxylan arabinofuranohydrolase